MNDHSSAVDAFLQSLIALISPDNSISGEANGADGIKKQLNENVELLHNVISALTDTNALSIGNQLRQKILACKGDAKKLAPLREALGHWYSGIIIADLCSYDFHAEPTVQLHQRMQILAQESLVWVPGVLFSQIVLQNRGLSIENKESEIEHAQQCVATTNGFKVKKLIDVINTHVAEHGSIISLNSHVRLNPFYCNSVELENIDSNILNIDYIHFDETQLPQLNDEKHSTEIDDVTSIELSLEKFKIESFSKSAMDFFNKIKELRHDDGTPLITNVDEKTLCMFHLPVGIDMRLSTGDVVSSFTHLIMVIELKNDNGNQIQHLKLPREFGTKMTYLCQRLSQFQTLQHLHNQAKKLQRSEDMLNELKRPLRALTTELNKTRESVFEIQAILNEPLDTILAHAPDLARFFEESKKIKLFEGVEITVQHEPRNYSSDEGEWFAARLLIELLGMEVNKFPVEAQEMADQVYKKVKKELEDQIKKASNYSEVAKSIFKIIGGKRYSLNNNFTWPPAVEVLINIKERLFTPFKPDCAGNPLTWAVLYAYIPVEPHPFPKSLDDTHKLSDVCLSSDVNPFATQGHLLQFISGIISAADTDEVNVTLQDGKKIKIEKVPNAVWIDSNNIKRLFSQLKREISAFALGSIPLTSDNWGNRMLPFIRLIRRLPDKFVEGETDNENNVEGKFIVFSRDRTTTLSLEMTTNEIKITVENLTISLGANFELYKREM